MTQADTTSEVCCATTCADVETVNVPGPEGVAGTNGTDGINAFTVLTASFIQPAANANVTVDVESSEWLTVGQPTFIEIGGVYEVVSKPSATQAVLENLGYTGNAAPAVVIPDGATVSPGGFEGATGPTGAAGGANTYATSTISVAGNVDVTIGASATEHSLIATVSAGAGVYTATYSLLTANATTGDIINILFLLPTSTNPTVEVHNASAAGTLLYTKTSVVGGDDVAFSAVYSGTAWVKLNANAVI